MTVSRYVDPNMVGTVREIKLTSDFLNLQGPPQAILTTGTLALSKTGVVAGTYATIANVVIDDKGRIHSATTGGGGGGVMRSGNTADSEVAVWVGVNMDLIRAVPVTITAGGDITANSISATTGTFTTVNATTGNITTVNSTTVNAVDVVATGTISAPVGNITTVNSTTVNAVTVNASSEITLQETGGGANTISFQAPASVPVSYTVTYPDSDGDPNQVWRGDGAGVLSNYTLTTGTYVPTLSNTVNFTGAVTLNTAYFMQVGTQIKVQLTTTGTMTAGSAGWSFETTLPVARTAGNFTTIYQGTGGGVRDQLNTWCFAQSVVGTERVRIGGFTTGAGVVTVYCDFTYDLVV